MNRIEQAVMLLALVILLVATIVLANVPPYGASTALMFGWGGLAVGTVLLIKSLRGTL